MATTLFLSLLTHSLERISDILDELGNGIHLKLGMPTYLNFGDFAIKRFPTLGLSEGAPPRQLLVDFGIFTISAEVLEIIHLIFERSQYLTINLMPTESGLIVLKDSVAALRTYELGANRRPKLLGLIREPGSADIIRMQCQMVRETKLDGVICRASIVPLVRKELGHKPYVVASGVRMHRTREDYYRSTLREAENFGADALIVGKELLNSPRPRDLLHEMLASLQGR